MRATRSTDAVVVPAVFAPSATTCLRSLGQRGIRTILAYESHSPPAFSSRYCDETVVTPAPADDVVGYKDALLSLARRDDVRAIVPNREADTYVLSRYGEEFAEGIRPLWPSFDALRVAHDRLRLAEAATEAGVPVPETQTLSDVDDWERDRIAKARYALLTDEYVDGCAPGQFTEPSSVHYLEAGTVPDREAIREGMHHDPIVQEYIPGPEYALWALYADGEPVSICQKRQVRAYNYAGGTSIYRETVRIPELETVGRALLDHLDWNGFASVQFKRDRRTGEFSLMEINPRTWISLSCPVRAGMDFPYHYWRLAGGESVPPTDEYRTGVGTHRIGGELIYLRSIFTYDCPFVEPPPLLGATREVLTSLYSQPNYDYLAFDDPLPFVRDVANWVSRKTAG
jgi:predicted ATP-grasp superfamily ATP-dependent carboligase